MRSAVAIRWISLPLRQQWETKLSEDLIIFIKKNHSKRSRIGFFCKVFVHQKRNKRVAVFFVFFNREICDQINFIFWKRGREVLECFYLQILQIVLLNIQNSDHFNQIKLKIFRKKEFEIQNWDKRIGEIEQEKKSFQRFFVIRRFAYQIMNDTSITFGVEFTKRKDATANKNPSKR